MLHAYIAILSFILGVFTYMAFLWIVKTSDPKPGERWKLRGGFTVLEDHPDLSTAIVTKVSGDKVFYTIGEFPENSLTEKVFLQLFTRVEG